MPGDPAKVGNSFGINTTLQALDTAEGYSRFCKVTVLKIGSEEPTRTCGFVSHLQNEFSKQEQMLFRRLCPGPVREQSNDQEPRRANPITLNGLLTKEV